jgi:hypothetical protein
MLLLIGLILVGCASEPRVELPDWNAAGRSELQTGQAIAHPIDLPALCAIPRDGKWHTSCWAALEAFDIVAAGNTDIARGHAEALRKTEAAYDALIEAGKYQQQLAEWREELLHEERKQRTMDKWYYRGLIALGLIAVGVGAQ